MRGMKNGKSGLAWLVAVRDAAGIVALCAVVGIAGNAARSDGIALVRREAYQILVPCPEGGGDAKGVLPGEFDVRDPKVLVIDARPIVDFAQWHMPRALSVPFDYLEAVTEANVRQVASSGAREVVVYGDGADPDSGEQLARELAGKGIRNVRFVQGGASAVRDAQGAP